MVKRFFFSATLLLVAFGAWGQNLSSKIDKETLSTRLKKHVVILASDSLEGRKMNTKGGAKAAQYIQNGFSEVGVAPFFESYITSVEGSILKNVVGVVEGTDEALKSEFVVVGGHFDHVGFTKDSLINRGADDNASGTAVVMELARIFKENPAKRTIIFVAFDGEEEGLLGSKEFVKEWNFNEKPIVAMVNFDMAGNLKAANQLRIDGVGVINNADSIARAIPVDGYEALIKPYGFTWGNMTDTDPFLAEFVPAVYIYTFPSSKYLHNINDTAERLDFDGLTKVALYGMDFVNGIANLNVIVTNNDLIDNYKGHSYSDQDGLKEIQELFTKQ